MYKTFAALVLGALSTHAQAEVVTLWDFNSVPPDALSSSGTLSPGVGLGTASVVGISTSSFSNADADGGSSDPANGDDSGWQTSGYATQGTNDKGRGVQFSLSTVGFKDIVITYDLRHSGSSSRYEQVQYSLDGTTFIDIATFEGAAGDTWFNGRSVDLNGLSGVNDNPLFAFRVVATFAPGTSAYAASNAGSNYGTTGSWRFDMVTVSAAPVPESETYALMLAGLGLVAGVVRHRRLG